MDAKELWKLFLATGLPEAYTLYCLLREEERAARRGKTA